MKTIWLSVGLCCCSLLAMAQFGIKRHADVAGMEPNNALSFLPSTIQERLAQIESSQVLFSSKKEGVVQAVNAAGVVVFEAGYKHKKAHGIWRSATENGHFYQGIPDGRWSFLNDQGALMAVRNYDAAKWRIAQQEFKHYNPKRGNTLPVAKAVQQGTRLDVLLQKQNGQEPFVAPFQGAMLHGTKINYHANGLVSDSCDYHHGLRHGDFVVYDANGTKREHGYYHHGDAHGGWTKFDAQGQITELTTYQHGKLIHKKLYQTGRP